MSPHAGCVMTSFITGSIWKTWVALVNGVGETLLQGVGQGREDSGLRRLLNGVFHQQKHPPRWQLPLRKTLLGSGDRAIWWRESQTTWAGRVQAAGPSPGHAAVTAQEGGEGHREPWGVAQPHEKPTGERPRGRVPEETLRTGGGGRRRQHTQGCSHTQSLGRLHSKHGKPGLETSSSVDKGWARECLNYSNTVIPCRSSVTIMSPTPPQAPGPGLTVLTRPPAVVFTHQFLYILIALPILSW